jgi:hypothetical protein
MGLRSSYASLCLGLRNSSWVVHSIVCTPHRGEEVTALFLLPPPGTSGRSSAIPARPSAPGAEGLGTVRFSWALELKGRRSARCPRVVARAGRAAAPPPKPPPRPAAGRLMLPWVSPHQRISGLVGGRGHRKGQLRVLGSPSALRTKLSLRTKEPTRTGLTGGAPGRGRGVRGPRARFVLAKAPWCIPGGY